MESLVNQLSSHINLVSEECHDKVSVFHLQSDNLMKCKIKIINFIYAWNDKRKQQFQDKLW